MDWQKLLCDIRFKRPYDKPPQEFQLNEFKHDQDLILFSQPFRRLQSKTQVHPLSDNDHVRTRLTHSIEVGMIGYVLGWDVGDKIIINHKLKNFRKDDIGNLVQAACLAHDIGNPPFGHIGEDAIKDWFKKYFDENKNIALKLSEEQRKDFELFDGNAQGFRILTKKENFKNEGGMRLTYATLATLMKYPCNSKESIKRWKEGKFSYFQSEQEDANDVAKKIELIISKDGGWCRHPLTYLVEAADDICYRIADLEDGIEMGSYTFDEYKNLFRIFIDNNETRSNDFESLIDKDSKISYLRSKAITDLAKQTVKIFIKHEEEILNGKFIGTLLDYVDDKSFLNETKKIAVDKIFKHEKKLYTEIASYEIIGGLLKAFTHACIPNTKFISQKNKHLINLMGTCAPDDSYDIYNKLLHILDYISGMTDKYAIGMYRQIQGITTGGMTPATIIK